VATNETASERQKPLAASAAKLPRLKPKVARLACTSASAGMKAA
jgi:hypothetical protein